MLKRNALILVLGLWSMAATAQVPVVEAGGRGGQQQQTQPAGNELLMTLYTQLEALQQEVQTLRGMVEEQSNQVRRMQTENRDRYLDVDRRLSELSGGGVGLGATTPFPDAAAPAGNLPGANPGVTQGTTALPPSTPAVGRNPPIGNDPPAFGNPATTVPATGAPPVTTPATGDSTAYAQLSEQDLYRTALNILLEQQPDRYEESIRMFQSYIDQYPQGRLLTNAYYWLGEALILVERYSEAREIFTVLINQYPQDPKAAGALLKRGDVYQRMGERALAEQDWREIGTRYPENLTEIREADSRLRRQP